VDLVSAYTVELTDEQAAAVELCWGDTPGDSAIRSAARLLADAIRANPPKPPRMAEPGQWGVVLATLNGWRAAWVRDGAGRWVQIATGTRADWDALADPQLVREGIES
jgi:hypothetical protein